MKSMVTRCDPDRLVYDKTEKDYIPAVDAVQLPAWKQSEMGRYWQQLNSEGDVSDD